MTKRSTPQDVIRYMVNQDFYSEDIGDYITDSFPVVYATEAEALALKERIETAADGFGGWKRDGADLYVTSAFFR